MMMERREHGLAYAIETLTTVVRKGITTKTSSLGIRRFVGVGLVCVYDMVGGGR